MYAHGHTWHSGHVVGRLREQLCIAYYLFYLYMVLGFELRSLGLHDKFYPELSC